MSRLSKLSKVATRDATGALHCPRCGGTQFKERRTNSQRTVIALTLLLLVFVSRKKQVQCMTCGAKFRRG